MRKLKLLCWRFHGVILAEQTMTIKAFPGKNKLEKHMSFLKSLKREPCARTFFPFYDISVTCKKYLKQIHQSREANAAVRSTRLKTGYNILKRFH